MPVVSVSHKVKSKVVRLWLVMRAITAVKTRQGSLITAVRFYDGALFLCLPEGLLAISSLPTSGLDY